MFIKKINQNQNQNQHIKRLKRRMPNANGNLASQKQAM
jgi:hypothetical protein